MDEKIYRILTINPGAMTTKLSVFENNTEIFKINVVHPTEELQKYPSVLHQFDMRKAAVEKCLRDMDFDIGSLSAIVARGGPLPPLKGGAINVNEKMLKVLRTGKLSDHPALLACMIGNDLAGPYNIPIMIYDPTGTSDYTELAKISGMPIIDRISLVHVLNSRYVGHMYADKLGKKYADMNLIIAHLGSGITIMMHERGRIVDAVSDDEGPFSPERSGGVSTRILIDECYSGKYDFLAMRKMFRGKGGLIGYLGTGDCQEVERRIADGDEYARLIYEAMAYQTAKCIGTLAPTVNGKIDAVILTGAVANSKMITDWVTERVSFLAPVEVIPGAYEEEALAQGGLRVLRGEEESRDYNYDNISPELARELGLQDEPEFKSI